MSRTQGRTLVILPASERVTVDRIPRTQIDALLWLHEQGMIGSPCWVQRGPGQDVTARDRAGKRWIVRPDGSPILSPE